MANAETLLPRLPLSVDHWNAITAALLLSPQESHTLELILRGAPKKQVAAIMGISVPTVCTYLHRIREKTGTHGTMEVALHVLKISHEVRKCSCHLEG